MMDSPYAHPVIFRDVYEGKYPLHICPLAYRTIDHLSYLYFFIIFSRFIYSMNERMPGLR